MSTQKKISKKKKKRIPVQSRARETKKLILDATAKFLQTHEVSEINTNEISKFTGISIGTFYQYYRSKEDLIAEVVEMQFQKDYSAFKELVNIDFHNFEDAVDSALDVMITLHFENKGLRNLVFHHGRDFGVEKIVSQIISEIKSLLFNSFDKYSKGEFVKPDKKSFNLLISSVVGAIQEALLYSEHEEIQLNQLKFVLKNLILGFFQRQRSIK